VAVPPGLLQLFHATSLARQRQPPRGFELRGRLRANQRHDLSRLPLPLGEYTWGAWQPNITQMIPASAGTAFLNEVLPLVTPATAGESVTVEIFAWKTSLFQRPLFRAPEEEHIFGIAMLRASWDPNDVPRMLSGNRTLLEKGRALGGTFYPFTAAALSRHDWKLHYGPYWDKLVNAKHDYDPFHVIASGPDLFRGYRD
jgi:cytokinin dehydrogenase